MTTALVRLVPCVDCGRLSDYLPFMVMCYSFRLTTCAQSDPMRAHAHPFCDALGHVSMWAIRCGPCDRLAMLAVSDTRYGRLCAFTRALAHRELTVEAWEPV